MRRLTLVASVVLLTMACSGKARIESCAGRNVLLVSIDTLRASRLGCYGGPRPTSPGLDAIAAESILFENALACSYHTADSHASIFTSTLPSVHEVSNASSRIGNSLAPGIKTLAEVLSAAGYATAGFHGGGNVSPIYGFGRGFDRYRQTENLEEASDWLAANSQRPFFIFAHTFHNHDPYTPARESLEAIGVTPRDDVEIDLASLKQAAEGRPFPALRDQFWASIDKNDPAMVAYALALYDAEILESDRMVTKLVREVLRVAPQTVVIITSDHGEEFGEHGKFLHDSLYQEVVHVPLIIRLPSGIGRRVSDRVTMLDLAPTILDILGISPPSTFQGRSLLPALNGDGGFRQFLVAEKMLITAPGEGIRPAIQRLAAAAILGDEKVLFQRPTLPIELYDLRVDPLEKHDLASVDASRRNAAEASLRRLLAATDRFASLVPRAASGTTMSISPELEAQLKALGYLN